MAYVGHASSQNPQKIHREKLTEKRGTTVSLLSSATICNPPGTQPRRDNRQHNALLRPDHAKGCNASPPARRRIRLHFGIEDCFPFVKHMQEDFP